MTFKMIMQWHQAYYLINISFLVKYLKCQIVSHLDD